MFEATFVTDPANASILHADALRAASSVTASGATRSNQLWFDQMQALHAGGPPPTETLDIEGQRTGLLLIQGGCAGNDEKLVDLGLKAIEWSLTPEVMGDGNWPDERAGDAGNNTHPRSVFIANAARGIRTVLQCPSAISGNLKARANAAKAGLIKAAQWMLASQDLSDFLAVKATMNQRLFAALALSLPGLWAKTDGGPLQDKGESIILDAHDRMLPDGTLPEAGGFDVSYQSVSIELLSSWIGAMQDSHKTVPPADLDTLAKATARWQAAWTPDGRVLSTVASRTTAMRYVPGPGPKGQAIDQYGQRAREANYILKQPGLPTFATMLDGAGPDFAHTATVAGP